MKLNTHLKIDQKLSGYIYRLDKGYAKVILKTVPEMVADEKGLIHGGFTFGAADFSAMAAVNEPNVVLVAADVKFTAPVELGDIVEFEAKVIEKEGRKAKVLVIGKVLDVKVFEGSFKTVVLEKHILD